MKKIYAKFQYIIFTCFACLIFGACGNTWVMYDTDQKDHLFFDKSGNKYTSSSLFFSLTFYEGDIIEYKIPIKLMGMPSSENRTFSIQMLTDTTKTIMDGDKEKEIMNAVEGEDIEFSDVFLPANSVRTDLIVKIHRSKKMENNAIALYIKIHEDNNFAPLASDSYKIYITDGDPSCPNWWTIDYQNVIYQWYMYLGKYTPDKYRKLLDLYWSMEETNPIFYYAQEEKYGRYFEKKLPNSTTGELTESIKTGFFQTDNPTIWAGNVLCPLFDYYKENYPDAENYTTGNPTVSTGGWKDPMALLR